MLKTTIAVDADLPSRLAIRYACQLGRSMDMAIGTVHVPQPGEQGQSIATGWVRQKWEDAVVRDSIGSVTRLVQSEQARCRVLESPQILPPGQSRDERVADYIRFTRCDLFVEGMLHRFEPESFLGRIGSALYRQLPCPILLVKNLTPMSKGVLWITDGRMTERMARSFLRLFPMQSLDLQVLVARFDINPVARAGEVPASGQVEPAWAVFKNEGRSIKSISALEGSPASMAPLLRDQFLIVSSVPRENGPMAQLLSMSPCSQLFLS